jgi:hypothetical protein
MKMSDYPPGFSTPSYRVTPEEIEQTKREIQITREKEERHRMKLIEEGKLRPDNKSDEKPA